MECEVKIIELEKEEKQDGNPDNKDIVVFDMRIFL